MSSRWDVKIAEAICSGNKANVEIAFGEIQSIKPLTVKISNTVISKNIYINPSLVLENETPMLNEFLKQFHSQYVLKKGDMVIALFQDTTVYIIQKVVKVS